MQFGKIADMWMNGEKFGVFKTFDICQKTKYQANAD